MRYNKDKVSIIIPAKNEGKGLKKVLSSLKPYSSDIIVIDGHSTDSTKEIIKASGANYFMEEDEGKGNAIKLGIRKAKNEYLIFFDADGSHVAKNIPIILFPLFKNTADAVIGSRRTGGTDELSLNLWGIIRSMGSDFMAYLVNKHFNTELSDILFSFRAIKKTTAKNLKLKSDGFEIEEEMVIKLLKMNYKIQEMPIKEYKRAWGKTKSHYTDGLGYIYTLVKELYF